MTKWTWYAVVSVLLILPASSQAVAPFNYPECVVYHPGSDRYFISNEGDGTIVQIDANWDTTYFSTELPLAVGMTIRGDTLYVSATPDGIVGFDLTGDTIALVIPVPGHTRLNDVCADSSGNLWVTDPQGANIFKVHIESRTSTLVAAGVTMVNGIHYDHGNHRLLLNQWIPDSPIRAMDPENYSLTTVLPTTGYDNLNGLTDDDRGNYYISAFGSSPYTNGMVIRYDNTFSGPPVVFSSGHIGVGDMCYNRHDSIMVVPNIDGQTVDFIPDPYRYDDDSDGHANALDNCPTLYNPGQEDADGDALGDTCDNCPGNYNPEQEDIDNDGIGDVCETNRSWYVRQDGSGDALTIQEAIDSTTHLDTILVDDGIYAGAGNSGLDFGGRRGILLHSENGPRHTIIDCQGSVAEPRRGFTFDNDEDPTFVVDGFTIKRGYGEVFMATACAGGMLFDRSSPTIKNCVFTGNSATMGGAIFTRINSPRLINCTFVGNSANYGAAIMAYDHAAPVLENCIIAFNQGSYPAFCLEFGAVTLVCNDNYGNPHGNWVGCLAGQEGVDGNFSADPLFCNVGIGDVGLIDETSPCMPANNECGVLIGALDVGCACNCGIAGDMDCGGDMNPLDVTYLVNYVYLQRNALCDPPNCPYPVGDLDCNNMVNPLDVAYLVNAVYKQQNAICDGCAP